VDDRPRRAWWVGWAMAVTAEAQASRISDLCAFFRAEAGEPGVIVEHGPTTLIFESPSDPRTGRFG